MSQLLLPRRKEKTKRVRESNERGLWKWGGLDLNAGALGRQLTGLTVSNCREWDLSLNDHFCCGTSL